MKDAKNTGRSFRSLLYRQRLYPVIYPSNSLTGSVYLFVCLSSESSRKAGKFVQKDLEKVLTFLPPLAPTFLRNLPNSWWVSNMESRPTNAHKHGQKWDKKKAKKKKKSYQLIDCFNRSSSLTFSISFTMRHTHTDYDQTPTYAAHSAVEPKNNGLEFSHIYFFFLFFALFYETEILITI